MKILLVEDDRELCASVENALVKNGYMVDCCYDGETAMMFALNRDYGYDLAIIDRMIPGTDGLTVIKAMRRKGIQIPVIIITGMSALDDRVDGLDGGADDYLVKPFHLKELMARVRALIRRPGQIRDGENISWGDLKLDRETRELWCHKNRLKLTARESELLYTLMDQPERVFTRDQLVLKVWGSDSGIEPGNVDNYISFLRKRLREVKSRCGIKTIYGTGFQMEEPYA
ncbi:MAG TPA: response regulator transcription factor [Candidatus Scybalocola faecavium]|nr:response regulator transcription factor [Candidatus Scybalocola faecavium]